MKLYEWRENLLEIKYYKFPIMFYEYRSTGHEETNFKYFFMSNYEWLPNLSNYWIREIVPNITFIWREI